MPDPDPRTAPDDHEDATNADNEGADNEGVSSEDPAEGADDEPAGSDGSPRDEAGERLVTLAVVIGAHGIGGECRLKVFAGDMAAYRSFNGGTLNATSIRGGSNGTIARFTEVPDRTAAEALRGTELRVPRDTLPPLAAGEYYHVDLIGLSVKSTDGTLLGTVVEIENFGAGDVIEIERPPVDGRAGKRFMVPMRPDAVPHWDDDVLTVDAAFVE